MVCQSQSQTDADSSMPNWFTSLSRKTRNTSVPSDKSYQIVNVFFLKNTQRSYEKYLGFPVLVDSLLYGELDRVSRTVQRTSICKLSGEERGGRGR